MPRFALVALALVCACAEDPALQGKKVAHGPPMRPDDTPCFDEQVLVDRFCIDKYEAYVVEIDPQGGEHPHSAFDTVDDLEVRAKVSKGVAPQGYISQEQAARACANAGKRLCTADEFVRACRGPDDFSFYPYGGRERKDGYCNEGKGSFVAVVFGNNWDKLTYADFNDPRINQLENGLSKTGAFEKCISPDGAFDMVGNLDEWTAEPPDGYNHGRFRGGWYGDAEINGPGCMYETSAHETSYHDYSTGFRCCTDAAR
jgi:hypothetical protein